MPSFIKTTTLPIIAIVFARILYAINWFNISSTSYLILSDFREDISMLGIITAGFLVGIGIFQVPAGILASKYDHKKIAFFGIMILSFASFLCGLVTELIQMVILRFIVGVGMAFFFGPSVVLISSFLGKGSEGLGIGILNSAHSLGGIIGIFGWIVLAEVIGWRASLIISGILGIASGIFLLYAISKIKYQNNLDKDKHNFNKNFNNFACQNKQEKNKTIKSNFKTEIDEIKVILYSKTIIIMGLSLLGVQIAWNIVSTFIVLYLKNGLYINSMFAGLIGSIPLIFNVIFSPIFGNIYDKIKNNANKNLEIWLLIICGSIVSINIAFLSFANIYTIIISITIIGIFISGGFVVPYTKAREIVKINLNQSQYETFAISFINGLSLFGAFWVPAVFSSIVKHFDYQSAWLISGFLTFIFIIPSINLKNNRDT